LHLGRRLKICAKDTNLIEDLLLKDFNGHGRQGSTGTKVLKGIGEGRQAADEGRQGVIQGGQYTSGN
jgi:hypothetical protein